MRRFTARATPRQPFRTKISRIPLMNGCRALSFLKEPVSKRGLACSQ
jgi:hypothetical protein